MKTILIADDEPRIAEIAGDYLKRAGFGVVTARDGAEALARARDAHPDLIVLDLGLPKVDGLDVARQVRRDSDVPIIMLTARVEESDKLIGLELGADDYVTKPFSPRELVARIRAVMRRVEQRDRGGDTLRVGDLVLDVPKMKASLDGRTVDLTTTEFQLLAALARHPGRVFTRAQLLDAIRGVAVESFERAIDAHLNNLRRKIEPDPRNPRYVLTVYGIGYKCTDE